MVKARALLHDRENELSELRLVKDGLLEVLSQTASSSAATTSSSVVPQLQARILQLQQKNDALEIHVEELIEKNILAQAKADISHVSCQTPDVFVGAPSLELSIPVTISQDGAEQIHPEEVILSPSSYLSSLETEVEILRSALDSRTQLFREEFEAKEKEKDNGGCILS